MYERGPSAEEMAAAGLRPEDFASDAFEVWPENWEVFCLFAELETQWRIGFSGPTGLDYNVLYHKLDRRQILPEQYDEIEADMRTMEREALTCIHAKD